MIEFLQSWGYIGLFLGAFMAATIIPFSSDILLIGILLAGRIGKWEWIEKWFHVSEEKLLKQKSKIDKYGSWIALVTWLPFVGDVFAIGLGFYKLNFFKCAVFMLIGKGARFAAWIALFYLKGSMTGTGI